MSQIEMHVDVGVLELSVDQLRSIMEILHKERSNDIDTPTQTRPVYQRTLFDHRDGEEDDDEENLD
jgi:hypothetical protein